MSLKFVKIVRNIRSVEKDEKIRAGVKKCHKDPGPMAFLVAGLFPTLDKIVILVGYTNLVITVWLKEGCMFFDVEQMLSRF